MNANGLLVIDKPQGVTSRDVVNDVAKRFPRRTKIGHAGTLDPLATGVLVVAVGSATRFVEFVQAMPKAYRTTIVLGATSDTDDADGTVTIDPNAKPISEAELRDRLRSFVGEIEQTPPAYSAALVDGQRAHMLARRGETVELAARTVRIDEIELLSFEWPRLTIEVHCGKGTYIRSIARDLGGYVEVLRRLRIGPFTVESADERTLLPTRMALGDMPTITVDADTIRRLRFGQSIAANGDGPMAVLDDRGELIAVGSVSGGVFRPDKVIPAKA